jgi:hypothetical protein
MVVALTVPVGNVEDNKSQRLLGCGRYLKLSLDFLGKVNGGGCSLERTALRNQFPVTGKNTGNYLEFQIDCTAMNPPISLYQNICGIRIHNSVCKEQGIDTYASGNSLT